MMIDLKYLFYKYKINCTGVLHCGASTAQERFVYDELNIPEVVWIEAIPEVYEQAKENLKPFPAQVVFNLCVSNEDFKEVEFNISNNEAQSSSFLELSHHKIIHPEVSYTSKLILQTIRLDTFFSFQYGAEGLNFGNFDLQGAELMALEGLGKLIDQFDYFYLEVNKQDTYKGCAKIWELDEYLMDFTRVETGNWVADSWTDALYIRTNVFEKQEISTDLTSI